MAFKMRSGNRPRFKSIGSRQQVASHKSSSPLNQKSGPITEEAWNAKTNTGTKGIPEDGGAGMDYIKADLASKGYKERLARELEAAGNKDYVKRAPNAEELEAKPDKSITTVSNPTSGDIMDMRTARSENIIFNDPSSYDKEGNYIGVGSKTYANADYIKRGKGTKGNNTNRLMPSTNVNFSDQYDWEGDQKSRIEGGDLIIHEGTHGVTAGVHGMLDNTKDILTKSKGGSGKKDKYGEYEGGELAQPQETYARYKVTQKYLKDKGLFDAFSGAEFTNKDVAKVEKLMKGVTADNYKSKGIPYEVFTFFGDDKQHPHGFNKKLSKKDMKNIFNNVADNSNNPNEIIDDGGNISMFS
tara:strand:+ start:680 stop:1747 length:1068 start_codon:yes stop_codon:yes gene_type:complete